MATKKRKSYFDPTVVKSKVAKRARAAAEIQRLGSELIEAVNSLFSLDDDDIDTAMSSLDERVLEVAAVARLGLKGVETLRFAYHHIPDSYCNKKLEYLSKIMGASGSDFAEPAVVSTQYQKLSNVLEKRLPSYWTGYVTGIPPPSYIDLLSLSTTEKIPFMKFIAPPYTSCKQPTCSSKQVPLYVHNNPVNVTIFTFQGPIPATKISLRCQLCKTQYNYSMFGKKFGEGQRFYEEERPLIEISDTAFVERQVYHFFSSLSLHCWVSFSGFAEAYFDYCTDLFSDSIKAFEQLYRNSGHHLMELSRKYVSDMFFQGEVESEIRETMKLNHMFTLQSGFDQYMENIEYARLSVYNHSPSDDCEKKGCGKCFTVDGNWKLTFPHCMFPVKSFVKIPGLHYANICPNEPFGTKAFCREHLPLAERNAYPTNIAEFVKYCGANSKASDEGDSVGESVSTAGMVAETTAQSSTQAAVLAEQGTSHMVSLFPDDADLHTGFVSNECRKDIGEKGKLRHWSRGHVFVVRSCGHIDTWKPIYKSESPSQVFLILLPWLYEILKDIPQQKWSEVVLAYDNMCHLDGLKVARSPLPLPPPYDNMWLTITKVIDDLHIRNHKNPVCVKKYSPKEMRESHPEYNFMTAEQTFTWLSRFKRILSSMKKTHHLYFLHRTVYKRNKYSEKCLKMNRKTLLPKAKD